VFNALYDEVPVTGILKVCPYLSENTPHVCYIGHSANVQRNHKRYVQKTLLLNLKAGDTNSYHCPLQVNCHTSSLGGRN
jgi:hypothetical protein